VLMEVTLSVTMSDGVEPPCTLIDPWSTVPSIAVSNHCFDGRSEVYKASKRCAQMLRPSYQRHLPL
jgi:hypothetical protein